MPSLCAVPGCSKRGGHTFPKDEVIRKKWVIAIKRLSNKPSKTKLWMPSDKDVVCYDHFEPTDYKIGLTSM